MSKGGSRGFQEGSGGVQGGPGRGERSQKHEKTGATPHIQDFVQEVPVEQMAQVSVPAVAHFQGRKGEVKPPKCPTRHPRIGGLTYCKRSGLDYLH